MVVNTASRKESAPSEHFVEQSKDFGDVELDVFKIKEVLVVFLL
jgi:hypothetical protein